MLFDILTIFPDLFRSPLEEGIVRQALKKEQIAVNLVNIRDFALDKHAMTDDRPFGGGEGMVMKPEPLAAALESVEGLENGRTILLSPKGRVLDQQLVRELADTDQLILICGRYEGVDERIREKYVDEELSIGDYILTGGELAAMVVVDAVTRVLPGVLGCPESAGNDTFSNGLLKHPQYTRPREFEGLEVPEVLLSGDHERVARFRFIESVRETLQLRPDLLHEHSFTAGEEKLLQEGGLLEAVRKVQEAGK
jgi:tRNA (guanine37-N1)-methyltransferase